MPDDYLISISFAKLLFHEVFLCGCTLQYICSPVFQRVLHMYLGTVIGCEFPFGEGIAITKYKKFCFEIQNSSEILTAVIWSGMRLQQ